MSEKTRLIQRMATLAAVGQRVPDALQDRLARMLSPRLRAPAKKKRGGKRRFYNTREWREFRYLMLCKLGARCAACGVTPESGATMNVDHIVPLRAAWERRFDPTNIQILCARCNQGKGGHDQTDWR